VLDDPRVSERRGPLTLRRLWLLAGAALLASALVGSAAPLVAADEENGGHHQIAGAGRTIIEGGTGAPNYIPVTTVLAFHANGQGGDFECLALAPMTASGAAGSGEFDVNAMYVTGSVTSVRVSGGTAVLKGTAVVTGLGAGAHQPFTFTVKAGGPGATATLDISGLTFHEILLEGQITIQ